MDMTEYWLKYDSIVNGQRKGGNAGQRGYLVTVLPWRPHLVFSPIIDHFCDNRNVHAIPIVQPSRFFQLIFGQQVIQYKTQSQRV
jgi:hypothetical protein